MKPPYPITEGWQSQNDRIDRYTIIGNVDGEYEDGVLRYSYTNVCEVSEGHDDAEGNLRLILAAPAMLKALRKLVANWDAVSTDVQVPDEINVDEDWDAARAALAQAEGRP